MKFAKRRELSPADSGAIRLNVCHASLVAVDLSVSGRDTTHSAEIKAIKQVIWRLRQTDDFAKVALIRF